MVVVKCNDALWSLDHLSDGGDGERALLFTKDFLEDSSELVILFHSARVSGVNFFIKSPFSSFKVLFLFILATKWHSCLMSDRNI